MARRKKDATPSGTIFANTKIRSWLAVSTDDSVYFTPTVYEHTMEPIMAELPQFCPSCKTSFVSRKIPQDKHDISVWGRSTHYNDVRHIKVDWSSPVATFGCPNKSCQHWFEHPNPYAKKRG